MGATEALSALDKVSSWMSPLSGIVDAIMRPLVKPLADQLDFITGDSEAVRGTSEKWRQMGQKVRAIGEFESQVSSKVAGDWQGDASDSFQNMVSQLLQEIEQIAAAMDDTAEFLDDAAMEVEVAEKAVEDLIRELIEWALLTLATSLALSFISFGASAAAWAAAAAAKAAATGSKIASVLAKVAKVLQELSALIKMLKTAKGLEFTVARFLVKGFLIKPVVKSATGLTGSPIGETANGVVHGLEGIAADEYDDQVDGKDHIQTLLRDTTDDVVGPVADHTRGPAHALDDITDEIDDRIPAFPGG
jgi:WXG100 family type VII secretion target